MEVPVEVEVEKLVKVPYLKPIEIVDQCEIVVEKIIKVPYLQPIELKTVSAEASHTV